MARFLKIFLGLSILVILIFSLISYFSKEEVDDNKNIETIVKNESNNKVNIEGKVLSKKTTDKNSN